MNYLIKMNYFKIVYLKWAAFYRWSFGLTPTRVSRDDDLLLDAADFIEAVSQSIRKVYVRTVLMAPLEINLLFF